MKAVVLDGYALNPGDLSWDGLRDLCDEFTCYDYTAPAETIAHIGSCEVVFSNKTVITREILDACPQVRFIGLLATGYNIIDIEAAAERGIPVCNVPSYSTASVAQMTIALLLEITNAVGLHSQSVHGGRWQNCDGFTYWETPQIELADKTFGIVGFGNTGMATAAIAQALGMRVLVYTRTPKPQYQSETLRFCALDEVLVGSDILSLHCPLFAETEKMIDAAAIAKMKDGAILLNTARGGLLDEQAVADALDSGKLYAAGLDVVAVEPILPDNPLLKAKNCLLTPHIAWATFAARKRLMGVLEENLRAFLEGRPQNVVNNLD